MQACYEIETEIPASHRINIQLPDTIPAGRVKVAIIYEIAEESQTCNTRMADFLASLTDHPGDGLSREEIRTYVDQERQSWDD